MALIFPTSQETKMLHRLCLNVKEVYKEIHIKIPWKLGENKCQIFLCSTLASRPNSSSLNPIHSHASTFFSWITILPLPCPGASFSFAPRLLSKTPIEQLKLLLLLTIVLALKSLDGLIWSLYLQILVFLYPYIFSTSLLCRLLDWNFFWFIMPIHRVGNGRKLHRAHIIQSWIPRFEMKILESVLV